MSFVKGINVDQNTLLNDEFITIGTLGPLGTSSEFAAKSFIEQHFKNAPNYKVSLHETFENCIELLVNKKLDYVIVPHAYEHINNFYMMANVKLIEIFRCDTPLYGLAVRKDFQFQESMLSNKQIVSHPAPISLIKHFLNKEVKFSLVNSTSIAAKLVKNRAYDLAITNDVARAECNLVFVQKFKEIPMSWSLFGREEN